MLNVSNVGQSMILPTPAVGVKRKKKDKISDDKNYSLVAVAGAIGGVVGLAGALLLYNSSVPMTSNKKTSTSNRITRNSRIKKKEKIAEETISLDFSKRSLSELVKKFALKSPGGNGCYTTSLINVLRVYEQKTGKKITGIFANTGDIYSFLRKEFPSIYGRNLDENGGIRISGASYMVPSIVLGKLGINFSSHLLTGELANATAGKIFFDVSELSAFLKNLRKENLGILIGSFRENHAVLCYGIDSIESELEEFLKQCNYLSQKKVSLGDMPQLKELAKRIKIKVFDQALAESPNYKTKDDLISLEELLREKILFSVILDGSDSELRIKDRNMEYLLGHMKRHLPDNTENKKELELIQRYSQRINMID